MVEYSPPEIRFIDVDGWLKKFVEEHGRWPSTDIKSDEWKEYNKLLSVDLISKRNAAIGPPPKDKGEIDQKIIDEYTKKSEEWMNKNHRSNCKVMLCGVCDKLIFYDDVKYKPKTDVCLECSNHKKKDKKITKCIEVPPGAKPGDILYFQRIKGQDVVIIIEKKK